MEIRPILSTLARHKMAAALIVLEIALSCAIICNALFIVTQRLETLNLASGMDDDRLVEIALSGIGQQTDADARTAEDLASLRAVAGVERVRQGQVFDVELIGNDRASAEAALKDACEKLLANTVIEKYEIELKA